MATAFNLNDNQEVNEQNQLDDRCASRQLSDRDTQQLVASLQSPKKPGPALRQAAEKFKKRYS